VVTAPATGRATPAAIVVSPVSGSCPAAPTVAVNATPDTTTVPVVIIAIVVRLEVEPASDRGLWRARWRPFRPLLAVGYAGSCGSRACT
jgi:hypothetical protein